jgi:hypothetical protein
LQRAVGRFKNKTFHSYPKEQELADQDGVQTPKCRSQSATSENGKRSKQNRNREEPSNYNIRAH